MAEFITDEAEFDTLLAQGKVLVVDCTATWCGPCRLVAPLIDQLAVEYGDRAQVFKLDIDAN
ncbi:MAG: thiol reductase thioredoxin, partial [Chamaesiphon sp.]|nr:thiol reductase thioredoxin [Chamaesiphon sp.]